MDRIKAAIYSKFSFAQEHTIEELFHHPSVEHLDTQERKADFLLQNSVLFTRTLHEARLMLMLPPDLRPNRSVVDDSTNQKLFLEFLVQDFIENFQFSVPVAGALAQTLLQKCPDRNYLLELYTHPNHGWWVTMVQDQLLMDQLDAVTLSPPPSARRHSFPPSAGVSTDAALTSTEPRTCGLSSQTLKSLVRSLTRSVRLQRHLEEEAIDDDLLEGYGYGYGDEDEFDDEKQFLGYPDHDASCSAPSFDEN